MASTAFLDVTFTKAVQLKDGCTDLSGNFRLLNGSDEIEIQSANVIGGKVRLLINQSQVPKTTSTIKLFYTDNSGNSGCRLVDGQTGFPSKDLEPIKEGEATKELTPTLPAIKSAVVKHETPKQITLTFTEQRDISNNSQNDDDSYGITITPSLGTSGAYAVPIFNGVVNNGSFPPVINQIILDSSGGLQYGSTISLEGGGINQGLGDQFDLSCAEFTTSVTNNVEQVILDGAYITNTDPSSVLLYFKKGTSGTILDISANYLSTDEIEGVFQCKTFNNSGQGNILYDVSGVDTVKYTKNQLETAGFTSTLADKYKDMSGVRFMLNEWPFQYGNGGQPENVQILFDISGGVPDECKLEDQYGNKIFNSAYDPAAVDVSLCNVTNNIQGIKVKSGNVLDNTGTDLSYNIILDFTTETGTTSISGELVGTPTPSQFKLEKNNSGSYFEVDKVEQMTDVSKVKVWVDYSKNTFDKIINKGDIVKFNYEFSSADRPWPTSIRDAYGNYVRSTGVNQNIDIVNNIDYSGNLPSSVSVDADGKTIDVECGFDISVNSLDEMSGDGGFTFNAGLDPTGVTVSKIEKVTDTKMRLTLGKSLYATSLPTLNYSNSGNITGNVTDCYGIKLNNKTGISVNVSDIPAPGRDLSGVYNSGWHNTFGKLDLSFNPTITSWEEEDRSGFKYKAEYKQNGSVFTDLETDGYVDIPVSNVEFHDNIITLKTGFNQSGASRGFSKKHTEGGDYNIKVKYVGPDISSNRPSGSTGYLPNFEVTMLDGSNNILDPSCNFDQSVKKTAVVLHDNPSQVLVAMQQLAYDGTESQGNLVLKWWDISNILFAGGPTFDLSVNSVNDYSSNSIDTVTGAYGGQNSNTRWIRTSYPIDMSTNDISLNYVEKSGKFITDQNGGVLASFPTTLDVTNQVKWVELVADGGASGNSQCEFEANYPFISADNSRNVIVQWDPTLSDFGGVSSTDFKMRYEDVSDNGTWITVTATGFSSQSPPSVPENRLLIEFPYTGGSQSTSGNHQLQYIKPLGSNGIKLNYDGGRWLKPFPSSALTYIRKNVPPTMTITATNPAGTTVTSFQSTSDPSLNLTFTSDKSTTNFTAGDIAVTNGTISDFTGSGTTYTATFTPTANGDCSMNVNAGVYTDIEGDGNSFTADSSFNWTSTGNTTSGLSIEEIKWSFNTLDGQGTYQRFLRVGIKFKDNTDTSAAIDAPGDVYSAAANGGTGTGPNVITNQFDISVNYIDPTNSSDNSFTYTKPNYAGTLSSEGGAIYDKMSGGGRADWIYVYWNLPFAPSNTQGNSADQGFNGIDLKYTRHSTSTNNIRDGTKYVNNFEVLHADTLWSGSYEDYDGDPTMTIASTTSGVTDGSSTNDSSIDLTFTATSDTTDFVATDITVTNGVISNFAGSGKNYTATFTPDGAGACTIKVEAGAFYSVQGPGNSESNVFDWTYLGASAPTFSSAVVERDYPRKIEITFSEAVQVTGTINKDNFVVYQDGSQGTISSAAIVSGPPTWNGKVELTLAESAPIQKNETVTVDYTKSGTASENLINDDSIAVDSFSSQSVTNNTVYISPLVRERNYYGEIQYLEIPYYSRAIDAKRNQYYIVITGNGKPSFFNYPIPNSTPIVLKQVIGSSPNYSWSGISGEEWEIYDSSGNTDFTMPIINNYETTDYSGGTINNISTASTDPSYNKQWKVWTVDVMDNSSATVVHPDNVSKFLVNLRDSSGNLDDQFTQPYGSNGDWPLSMKTDNSLWWNYGHAWDSTSNNSMGYSGLQGFGGQMNRIPASAGEPIGPNVNSEYFVKEPEGIILKYTATENKTIAISTKRDLTAKAPFTAPGQVNNGGEENDSTTIVFTQQHIDEWLALQPSPTFDSATATFNVNGGNEWDFTTTISWSNSIMTPYNTSAAFLQQFTAEINGTDYTHNGTNVNVSTDQSIVTNGNLVLNWVVTSPGSVASTFNGLTYTKNSTEIYNVEDISSNWVNGFTDETVSTTFTFAFQASGSEYKRNNIFSLETLMDWEQDISMNILPTDVSYNDFRSQFDISFNGGGSGKEFTWSDLTSDGYGVTFGKLRINWTGGQLEPTTGISMVAVKYTKHSTMTRVHLVNSNGGEADDFTTFQEISYPPEITSKSITNANPKRINFTTSSPISVLPDKNDFTFSNMTPNPDGTMASFANDWTIGADVSSNENLPTTSFYYEGGSEWQYNASGELAYTGDVLYDFDDIAITNNVETPFFAYPGPGGANQSWINKDEPNSVYMGFRFDNGIMRNSLKEGNWAPDATYDVDRINKTKNFKFVTTNIDDGLDKINIIDVSRVSIVSGVFVDTTSNPTTYEDISMVKFDLSRNSNDISNVDNPYSFTSRDNIHMWWDYSGFSNKAYRFSDSSGNEIFDSSANVKFINTNYNGNLGNDMSGNVANTTSSNLTGRWDGTPPNHFGALKIVNLIQDISMVSGSVEENESSEEILKIVFQNDVSFNSPIMTSINTDDWQVDISGAGTSQLWETLPDVSKNTISVFDEDSAHNTLLMTFDPTTGVFHHGDEIKITLKPMNDKPLSRQYIDISGNKLIPYNISNDGNGTLVTNNLS